MNKKGVGDIVLTIMTIPKLVHQIWIQGEEHLKKECPQRYAWTRTIGTLGGGSWKHRIWSGDELYELLTPELKLIWDKAPNLACKADIGRLVVLQKHGGLYLDVDYLVLKDFDFLFSEGVNFLCVRMDTLRPYERAYVEFNNAVLGSAPNHPLIEAWLSNIVQDGAFGSKTNPHRSSFAYTCHVTGYHRLNQLLKEDSEQGYLHDPSLRIISNTMLEPLTLNNQHMMCDTLETCSEHFPSAFGIHLTDGSWIDSKVMKLSGRFYGSVCDWSPILFGVFLGLFVIVSIIALWLWFRCRKRKPHDQGEVDRHKSFIRRKESRAW